MLDTTYKTNRFKLPLLNICGVTQLRQAFQIAAVFLEGEKEEPFNWAISGLCEYLTIYQLPKPRCFVTDRDHALINAITAHPGFEGIPGLICRWHINMNVLQRTKPFFPKPTRLRNGTIERHPTFASFLRAWNELIGASSEAQFDELLVRLQTPDRYPLEAVTYVVNIWIEPHKYQFVRCFVDNVRHFGHTSTSIAESSHASMKRWIRSSTGDLATVFRALMKFWDTQSNRISISHVQRINRLAFHTNTDLLSLVRSELVPQALDAIIQELRATLRALCHGAPPRPPTPCGGSCPIITSMGLPCRHILVSHDSSDTPLQLTQFDEHWRWYQPSQTTNEAITNGPHTAAGPSPPPGPPAPLLNPLVIRGKGRPKGAVETSNPKAKRGHGKGSTIRELSGFESAEVEERRDAVPPASTAPPVLQLRQQLQKQRRDTYEPGTVNPRASQRCFDNDIDELIPERLEGRLDRQLEREEIEEREAYEEMRALEAEEEIICLGG
jgi:hypothetical protein